MAEYNPYLGSIVLCIQQIARVLVTAHFDILINLVYIVVPKGDAKELFGAIPSATSWQ